MQIRPSWDSYFIEIAKLVSSRSTCIRRKVGAVIVKGRRILSTGYNGAPSGLPHCAEVGCLREKLGVPPGERHELCRGVHAEQNAIIQAAKFGVCIDEATLYVTDSPCFICAREVINAGIKRIIYKEGYPDKQARDFLRKAGIQIVKWRKDEKVSVSIG